MVRLDGSVHERSVSGAGWPQSRGHPVAHESDALHSADPTHVDAARADTTDQVHTIETASLVPVGSLLTWR
ncbi:hypothetical protein RU01_09800 [Rhodococcus sp. MEB064]|nr:hypothetical protein RU01_09800 [Rhodococcus sp. MEB064]